MTTVEAAERASAKVGLARLAIGLAQGVALYVLYRIGQEHDPLTKTWWYQALLMVSALGPAVLLADLGRTPTKALLTWFIGAVGALAGLGAWTFLRMHPDPAVYRGGNWLGLIWLFPLLLFIAHHLVVCAIQARRLIAPYASYFDSAWSHALQVELSLLFLAIFWAVLWLGAMLFDLIGIKLLHDLIDKPWFDIPLSSVVFAGAVHLTDVRIGMVRGFRTLVLTLFSVLLPLTAGLSALFLVGLVAKGMNGLWAHKSTAGLLLYASAQLILLLNAAYQDGRREDGIHKAQRWVMRSTPLILMTLTLLAAYAIGLRVAQYGWTPGRVVAAAGALIALAHAGGYVAAVFSPGRFMGRLEITNVLASTLVVLVLLALLSPLCDPARISVDSQVAALKAGRIKPDKFDYDFLRFRSAKFGQDALKGLAVSPDKTIANRANEALRQTSPWGVTEPVSRADLAEHIVVHPKGQSLPADFLSQKWTYETGSVSCLWGTGDCDAYFVEIDRGGQPEILLAQFGEVAVFKKVGSSWTHLGTLSPMDSALVEALKTGPIKAVPSPFDDLEIAGRHEHLNLSDPSLAPAMVNTK